MCTLNLLAQHSHWLEYLASKFKLHKLYCILRYEFEYYTRVEWVYHCHVIYGVYVRSIRKWLRKKTRLLLLLPAAPFLLQKRSKICRKMSRHHEVRKTSPVCRKCSVLAKLCTAILDIHHCKALVCTPITEI